MGANCCVAVRDKTMVAPRIDVSSYRNIRYSPSWSLRWDNRTHIEDIMETPARFSPHGEAISEIKSGTDSETEGISSEGSPRSGVAEKSRVKAGVTSDTKDGAAELLVGSNSSTEEKGTMESGSFAISVATDSNPLISVASSPSSSALGLNQVASSPSSSALGLHPSSSRTRSLPADPTSSRQACRSPGFPLSRQVSDSRIPKLKSLNETNSPEGRQSFVLSMSDNDLSMGRSQGGSSEGWSTRTFTELVSSSQRERWSFDSESIKGKLVRSNTHPLPVVSPNQQTCGVCTKLLKERSPWSPQKIVSTNELSVVAVLVCGHVYHSECLENMTAEADRFEPSCPVCSNESKTSSKLSKKETKARSKISRIAVADADGNLDSSSAFMKEGGRGSWTGTSSSMKSFSRPFLRRHFSIGSRPSRLVSENESTRKKGFWARYRRD